MSDENPELQTFEIYLPPELISRYKQNYLLQVDTEIGRTHTKNENALHAESKLLALRAAVPIGLDMQILMTNKRAMNKVMIKQVEQVRADPNTFIRTKSWSDYLLNRTPSDLVTEKKIIMFKDFFGEFSKTFSMGMDFDYMMLDILILTAVEAATKNSTTIASKIMLGVLFAYLIDSFLFWLRSYLGKRNLSRHTLVDDAFLI